MATNAFTSLGLNHAAILNIDGVNRDYHLFQQFLDNSKIKKALTEPGKISASQIKAFWESGVYSGDGSPEITFTYKETSYTITLTTARETLGQEDHNAYTVAVGDMEIRRMLTEIGYDEDTTRLGQLKIPNLRKEWSFFFDSITRAFQPK